MTSNFLNVYMSNLEVLSNEMTENRLSVQFVDNSIKSLTVDVQQKLKELFVAMITQQSLHDNAAFCSQTKIIYLLLRQIQKSEAVKRALTRKACDILDKYLATIDEELKSTTKANHINPNAEDSHGDEMLKTLFSNKIPINQPVQGTALIVELIKKMENGKEKNSTESDEKSLDIEVTSSVENLKSLTFDGMPDQFKDNLSDLMHVLHRMDNLQVFNDKVMDICSDMKNRYKMNYPTITNSEEDEISSTEEDAELCYCRSLDMGRMVACDNANCKIKWYHFECVGLYKNPEGSWYCPSCFIFENVTK